MRTLEQIKDRHGYYGAAEYLYIKDVGYIVWHFSTGENLEPLFIEVAEKRKGYGTELYRRMVLKLIADGRRPYHSVFAYRLTDNKEAEGFYNGLGFTQIDLGNCIYKDRGTTLMWSTWDNLIEQLEIEPLQ